MDTTALIAALQSASPGAQIEAAPSVDLHSTLIVSATDIHAVALALRDTPGLEFGFLAELTAVDYHPRAPRFEVVYVLVATELRQRVRLKVPLAADAAHLATVSDVWPAANWLEREVWDMFGIEFEGHPDPRRLLMPEDWEGFPLRKDYPVQIRLKPRATSAVQVTEQEFRANLEHDRLTRKK